MSFARGFLAFFQGVAFLVRTPRLWWRALVPVMTALALLAGLGALGACGAFRLAHHLASGAWGIDALTVLFAVPAFLVALLLAVAFAQPLSGWALDAIVREQHRELGLASPERLPGSAALSSLGAAILATILGLPLMGALTALGWLVPPTAAVTVPLKIALFALLLAWDLIDYPFAMQGMRLRERARWCARHFGAVLGFGLGAAIFFVVPGLGLLALPAGVAGATRLAAAPRGSRYGARPTA